MDIRTKFNVGDEVFTIKDMRIISFVVKYIDVFSSEIGTKKSYSDESCVFFEEEKCFKTRKELLAFIQGDIGNI